MGNKQAHFCQKDDLKACFHVDCPEGWEKKGSCWSKKPNTKDFKHPQVIFLDAPDLNKEAVQLLQAERKKLIEDYFKDTDLPGNEIITARWNAKSPHESEVADVCCHQPEEPWMKEHLGTTCEVRVRKKGQQPCDAQVQGKVADVAKELSGGLISGTAIKVASGGTFVTDALKYLADNFPKWLDPHFIFDFNKYKTNAGVGEAMLPFNSKVSPAIYAGQAQASDARATVEEHASTANQTANEATDTANHAVSAAKAKAEHRVGAVATQAEASLCSPSSLTAAKALSGQAVKDPEAVKQAFKDFIMGEAKCHMQKEYDDGKTELMGTGTSATELIRSGGAKVEGLKKLLLTKVGSGFLTEIERGDIDVTTKEGLTDFGKRIKVLWTQALVDTGIKESKPEGDGGDTSKPEGDGGDNRPSK